LDQGAVQIVIKFYREALQDVTRRLNSQQSSLNLFKGFSIASPTGFGLQLGSQERQVFGQTAHVSATIGTTQTLSEFDFVRLLNW
jgi:hypothetical protein